jgi:hypothetical protein
MAHDIAPPADDSRQRLLPEVQSFSLVLGGPLYQLFRKVHLDDDVGGHVRRRIVVICGVIWLPLLVLCAIEGTLLGGVAIPFLFDVETHARFLVAVPLLVAAELLVHLRMRYIVVQFVERKLVPAGAVDRFRVAIRNAMTWRNSIVAELALVAIVFTLGYYLRADRFALEASTWYATSGEDGGASSLAGFWLTWVSNPILQLLLLRWLYRLAIWARLLWQASRIDLDLIPTHPDRNGGLGFLGASARLYAPLLAALSAMVAGLFASRIFYDGASLADFKLEVVVLVAIGCLLVLGPLTVFAPQILAAKRKGLREYGAFAADYMRAFDRRWLRSEDHDQQALLGAADIQSLADLGNAFTVVKEMKAVPFGRDTFLAVVWATVAPIAPLVLTMIPLDELLDRIIGAVL